MVVPSLAAEQIAMMNIDHVAGTACGLLEGEAEGGGVREAEISSHPTPYSSQCYLSAEEDVARKKGEQQWSAAGFAQKNMAVAASWVRRMDGGLEGGLTGRSGSTVRK